MRCWGVVHFEVVGARGYVNSSGMVSVLLMLPMAIFFLFCDGLSAAIERERSRA